MVGVVPVCRERHLDGGDSPDPTSWSFQRWPVGPLGILGAPLAWPADRFARPWQPRSSTRRLADVAKDATAAWCRLHRPHRPVQRLPDPADPAQGPRPAALAGGAAGERAGHQRRAPRPPTCGCGWSCGRLTAHRGPRRQPPTATAGHSQPRDRARPRLGRAPPPRGRQGHLVHPQAVPSMTPDPGCPPRR